MEEKNGTVCVTGGTGYVASWLIMRLLQRGYTVRATVRSNPENKRDLSYITNLPGAAERLKIYNAELNKPESFKEAIEGCVGVFHVAHPMKTEGKEAEELATKTAVEGLLGILNASLNSKSVKKVVYTSTLATIMYNDKGLSVTDESTWSDIDICRRNTQSSSISSSYLVSKTVTEKTALDFATKNELDLVTVVLPLVVGPFICPYIPSSISFTLAIVFGKQEMYKNVNNFYMVHIDDAVDAHIFLFENPNAKGRYICSSIQMTTYATVQFLSAKYHEYQASTISDDFKETEDCMISKLSSMKLLDLGFKYRFGMEEMFDGAIQCCKDRGFLRHINHVSNNTKEDNIV
ncbi:vestitone reductase isoform X2 [Mercurialis annua]|uniref:vestitone reductase isoform X2 n=1 Tax=Mercurialis annua TaxID=3986 RepID=UPI00215E5DBA|nr:vestitone reductase isoform X2 [Mercurialis annua]